MSGVVIPAHALAEPVRPIKRLPLKLLIFTVATAVAGSVAGIVWWQAVIPLPGYVVAPDGRAATTERGLALFVAADAWFTVLGMVFGLAVGALAWRLCSRLGWRVVLLAAGGAFAAALVCWMVGHRLGPSDFAPRLVSAKPGELVPIELTLRAKAALAAWPFAATIPVLLGSSLGRDDEIENLPLDRDH
jgi:hypothetical protein